jgi:chemotaxis protein CheD
VKTYQSEPTEPDRERLFVGVSEYAVAEHGETLVAYGLGACVGVLIHDPDAGVGGLAHPMLPRQEGAESATEAKYVDAAVERLLRETLAAGATYGNVEGYIVGGADLLDLPNLPKEVSGENVAVARSELNRLGVPVEAEAVGGSHGRTVEFDTGTGAVRVVTAEAAVPRVLRDPGVTEA